MNSKILSNEQKEENCSNNRVSEMEVKSNTSETQVKIPLVKVQEPEKLKDT